MTKQPQPPQNVRVVRQDGTEVPVECVYDGYRDGLHCWVAPWPVAVLGQPFGLKVGVLPAATTVTVAVRVGEG